MVGGVTHRRLVVPESGGDEQLDRVDVGIVVQLTQCRDALGRLLVAQPGLNLALGRAEFVLLRLIGRLGGRGFLGSGRFVVRAGEIRRTVRRAQQHQCRNRGSNPHRHQALPPRLRARRIQARSAGQRRSRSLPSILGRVIGRVNAAPAYVLSLPKSQSSRIANRAGKQFRPASESRQTRRGSTTR